MADFLTFAELLAEAKRVANKIKGTGSDSLIKQVINMVYFEMLSADELFPLHWMVDFDDSLFSVGQSVITGITGADPGVVTTDEAHGLTAGDVVMLHNIVGMTELNGRLLVVGTVGSSTTFNVQDINGTDLDTSGFTAYSSAGVVNNNGKTLATSGKNVQMIIHAKWHDEDSLVPITLGELEEKNSNMSDSVQRPGEYMHRKQYTAAGAELNQILWFQGADSEYRLRYWFEKRASPLSADANVPLLPPQFHRTILAGVATRLAENNVQVENAVIWPGLYQLGTAQMITFNRKYYKDNNPENKIPYLI